jgi:adenylate cyclase
MKTKIKTTISTVARIFNLSNSLFLPIYSSLILLFSFQSVSAQTNLDSLLRVWNNKSQPDSIRVEAYKDYIQYGYLYSKPDSAALLAEALQIYAKQYKYPMASGHGYRLQGAASEVMGNFTLALQFLEKSLAIEYKINNKKGIAGSLHNIGNIYHRQGDYPVALEYYQKARVVNQEQGNKKWLLFNLQGIGQIYIDQGNYPRALEHFQECIEIQEELGNKQGLKSNLNNMGIIYFQQGNYPKALEYFEKTLRVNEELGDEMGIAGVLGNIGMIYYRQLDYPRALEYLKKSMVMYKEIPLPDTKKGIANSLGNIGSIYADQGNYPQALEHFEKSLAIKEEIGDKPGVANSMGNMGLIFYKQFDYPRALEYFEKSLAINKEIGDKNGIGANLNNIGILYQDQGNNSLALVYCQKSLAIAEEIGALDLEKDACECLSNAHEALGKIGKALEFYKRMIVARDSIYNEENTKKLVQIDMQYEFDRKEAAAKAEQEKKDAIALQELKRQKLVRNGFVGGFAVVLLFAGVFFKQRNKIGKEKKRSEELLLNILPAEVAEELKAKGAAEAQLIDDATVLFTDFKGFTGMSEILTAKELVSDLNHCFTAFDEITHKHRIEKIKTIGDAYMAAGGLPTPNKTHAKDVVLAALEICDFIEEGKAHKIANNQPFFEIRIGIHTGPLVAGIVGVKKFQYDIWGDTVNTASRMESSGEVGKVNVSQFTYELLKDDPDFEFEHRGKISAKGKGEIEMLFVSLKNKND